MDTSKEYIKMCERAEEIQKEYFANQGDFVYHKKHYYCNQSHKTDKTKIGKGRIGIICSIHFSTTLYTTSYINKVNIKDVTYLPRQDQLQGIYYKDDGRHSIDIISTLEIELFGDLEYYSKFNSMEQLWLAFVMKEKYHKVWDGKEWIK